MNATLNISIPVDGNYLTNDDAPTLEELSWAVADMVAAQGVTEGRTTPNMSVVGGRLELGVTVELYDVSPAETLRVWGEIRETYGLGCCWIVVTDDGTTTYEGCIKGWWAYAARYTSDVFDEANIMQDNKIRAFYEARGQAWPPKGLADAVRKAHAPKSKAPKGLEDGRHDWGW